MIYKEWKRYKLEDIANFYDHKRVPLNSREREDRKGIYPYYGASGIVDFIDDYIFNGDYVLISEDGENLRSRQTPIAFRATGRFWVNNHAHVIKGKEPFINDWIIYFFHSFDINPYITGAVQPKLNRENLELIEIPLPKVNDAKKIISILKSLDDKIELNRQINATLEAIAQAIFKEWFVNFNFPGATGEMVEAGDVGAGSEPARTRMIPKGWRVGELGEICKNIRIGVQPKEISPDAFYVGLEHIPRKTLGLTTWGYAHSVGSQKSYFRKYEILFGKLRPYFHKVCIAPFDGICSTDILVIEPIKCDYFSFCINHLYSDELISFVSAIADGTRMPRVDWNSISKYSIIIPDENIMIQFNRCAISLYKKILENNNQSNALATIRDSLMPKLMSGEIEV
ncbi:MAG: restriction endonuclease subunit S [Anaerolineales bacterium]|nr:restriction endonuclease subunit S [Anaerolineales bacterium]